MRVRKKKWAQSELSGNPLVLPEGAADKRPGMARLFERPESPLHLEIGCGKGRFIAETAAASPGTNFVAMERDPTIVAQAARLAREKGAPNIRFLIADADFLLDHALPGEVSRLYINFCDPWPTKKKRARRRLTHDRYIKMYEDLLIPEIFFKTDNRALFEFSLESFSRNGWLLSAVSLDLHNSGDCRDNVVTEYEEKFSALGPIYRLEARKRCG